MEDLQGRLNIKKKRKTMKEGCIILRFQIDTKPISQCSTKDEKKEANIN